jgi:putative aldouronate transport system substrate-binding protein
MPACKIGYGHPTALIRGDLREKYGLEPLKTPADLTAYMKAVAADKDSGVAYAYNASLDGKYLQNVYYITPNNLLTVDNSNYFYYQYVEGKTDYTADDIFFIYGSEEFKAFAQQQKELAAEGLWSRSSINNQTDVKDSFLNGTSALFINNLGTTGNVAASVMKANPEWKPEIYDLNLDKVSTAVYDADGYAVTYKSKNVERALMALDVLKNDPTAYVSIRYGIPGYHITINEDGTYSKTENYGTNHWSYGAAPSWGLKNTLLEMDEQGIFPTVPELMKTWGEISVDSPTVAFAFSTTGITDAWSAMGETYTQFIPLVQLGLVDDLDGWMEEFMIEAEAAGLDEIKAAIADQLNAYFGNL